MTKRAFVITNDLVSVVIGGKPYTVMRDDPKFQAAKDILHDSQATDADILKLYSREQMVKLYAEAQSNEVTVKGGVVYYKGEPMHNAITRRMLQMIDEGLDIIPIMNFLNNLMQNPSHHSVKDTYAFMEHQNLPITPDGCFLAYKYINHDYTDCHTGKIDNSVGNLVQQDRNLIDDDWRNLCSSGLHVGSHEYAFDGTNRRRVIVKVNPRDVVAVAAGECKCRACEYKVLYELKNKSDKLPDHFFDDGSASTKPSPAKRAKILPAKKQAVVEHNRPVKVYKGKGNSEKELRKRANAQKRGPGGRFLKKS